VKFSVSLIIEVRGEEKKHESPNSHVHTHKHTVTSPTIHTSVTIIICAHHNAIQSGE